MISSTLLVISLLLLIQQATCAPVMHTYIDYMIPDHRYKNLLEIWKKSWESAGWQTKVLSQEDAMKHPLYVRFKEKMDSVGVVHFNRNSYLRNLAMESECSFIFL